MAFPHVAFELERIWKKKIKLPFVIFEWMGQIEEVSNQNIWENDITRP